jgi:hypothetical protein
LERPHWSAGDLEVIARQEGLMLGGAIEAVNEWSLDEYGDLLLAEEDEEIIVNRGLVNTE